MIKPETPTTGHSVIAAARRLQRAGVAGPRLEAERLLAHVLSQPRHACYLAPDRVLTREEDERLEWLVSRRAQRIPYQYLIGRETFCDLELEVTPEVLIPRPETQGVVAAALRFLSRTGMTNRPPVIVDLGTGSGCIALALAIALPDAVLYATDCSPAALGIARRNADRHRLSDRVKFLQGDLFEPLQRAGVTVDLVVSNPPYVAEDEMATLQAEVRCEPAAALRGGVDGLEYYRRILTEVGDVLGRAGAMVLEIGFGQAEAVRRLADGAGCVVDDIEPDEAGIPRVAILRTGVKSPHPSFEQRGHGGTLQ